MSHLSSYFQWIDIGSIHHFENCLREIGYWSSTHMLVAYVTLWRHGFQPFFRTPLSERKIWFKHRHHQRKLCHFTSWSISFQVRYVSKKLVWPKGVKIEAEKGWVVKEWEFWKMENFLLYQFFKWFNCIFMVCG